MGEAGVRVGVLPDRLQDRTAISGPLKGGRFLSLIPQRSAALLFHGPEKTNVSLVSLCLWASFLPSPHTRPPLHLPKDPQRMFCPFQPSSPLETHTHPHLTDMPKFQNEATQPSETSLKCPCGRVCCQVHPASCHQSCKSGGLDSSPGCH